jgi:hypothetical protein
LEGDGEASYAHYALQKLHILPSVFADMDEAEKAFVIASCNIRVETEKEEARKLKKMK